MTPPSRGRLLALFGLCLLVVLAPILPTGTAAIETPEQTITVGSGPVAVDGLASDETAVTMPSVFTDRTEPSKSDLLPTVAPGFSGNELVVIDTTVQDHQELARVVREARIDVVKVSSAAEMQAALANRSNLAAVHVLSHGTIGTVQIGDDTLQRETLNQYSGLTGTLGRALAPDGDLLLYGCRVAENGAGRAFVSDMASATGSDVAASDDLTGNASRGGDWVLEVQTGSVTRGGIANENTGVLKPDFTGILASISSAVTIDFNAEPFAHFADYGSQTYTKGNFDLIYNPSGGGNWYEDTQNGEGSSNALDAFGFKGPESVDIINTAGDEFDFNSFYYYRETAGASSWTIEGFRDGSSTGTQTVSVPDTGSNTVNLNSVFDNVDKVTISESDGDGFTATTFDSFEFSTAVVPNSAPTFDNGASTTITVNEDSSANDITSALAVTDSDGGDTLTWSVSSAPNNGGSTGGFTDSQSAGTSVTPSGLTYTPGSDISSTTAESFDVQVSDGTDTDTITVSVNVRDAPELSTITRDSPTSQETNADSVTYGVTFNESVTGVDMGDFAATQVSGDVSASVSGVSGSGSSYTVTVDTITGDGSLRLDVADDDSITNGNGVPLGGVGTSGSADGSYTSGETYSIDNTDPGFDSGVSASVSEGTTGNVLNVEAGDDGTGNPDTNVDYSLGSASGSDAAAFSIDTGTGQLTLDAARDFENPTDSDTNNDYQLTVTATDDAGNTAEQTITVSITDVNEAPAAPTDSDGAADSVAETATNGATVGVDATTTDPEGDAITWSLDDDAGGRFAIDASGVVTVADTTKLDYETATSHTITVNASDGSLSATTDIPITITDSDETPSFTSTTTASVSETATAGTSVQDVNADVGGSDDDGVSYQFTAGNGDGAYAIDSNTGAITVGDASKIDYETATSRTVTVEASEGSASDTQDITISVTDVDETPSFTSGTSDTVAEDATNGDPVTDVDADVGGDSDEAVSYTITGGNSAGAFTIDGTTGQIDVADNTQFDHEGTNSFSLTIQASEGAATNSQTVSISITDVDETPTFASVGSQTVNESATAGTNIVDIDADVNANGDTPVDTGITYAITAGNSDVAGDGGDAFAIDANTGQITVNDADDVDRSAQQGFTLTVEASEGSQNATQDVTIDVIDDVAPTLTGSDPGDDSTGHVPGDSLTLTFDEPISFGTGLITLRKNDSGFSDAETFDVTVDTGSADGNVSISGSQLTINPTSDLIADTEYAVQITATAINDTAATPNAYAGISTDEDLDFRTANTKPSFAQATAGTISVSVDEDGTLDLTSALEVTDISASDTLTWSLPTGDPDASNGTVSDLDGESVSFSSGTSHTLTSAPEYVPNADFAGSGSTDDSFDVTITDGDAYTETVTVEVDVQQVNDAPSVTLGDNQTVNGTTSQQTVDGFATFAPSGGSDEAGQSVDDYTVTVASDPDGVLSAVDIDNDGNLTYTANDSVEGTATVAVAVRDDGGTANGGTNTSATVEFDITVDTRAPTVDSASTTARTLTLSMDEPLSETAATTPPGENFTVTVGGDRINVSTVTISGSTISLGLDSPVSFGKAVTLNYTRGTNITEDLATNQLANFSDQPVTNTVNRPNRGRRGGGGGSDSGDTGPTVTVEPESESDDEADAEADDASSAEADSETDEPAADDGTDSRSVSVRGVTGGERVRIDLSGTGTESSSADDAEDSDGTESGDGGPDSDGSAGGDGSDGDTASERPRNVVADGLDIQFAESGDYDLAVRTRDADISDNTESDTGSDTDGGSGSASRPDLSTNSLDDEGRRFARETRQRPVGFIQVDTQFEEDAVETATHRFRVSKSYLESTGADVESVRLYRDEISQWRELQTRQVGASEEYYFFEADTPGFSVFVIGTSAPVFETSTPTLRSFNETTGEVTAIISVENIGSKPGVFESTLSADGATVGTIDREIAAGATVEIPVSGIIESSGTVTLRFAGQSIGEVTRSGAVPEESATASGWLLVLVAGVVVVLAVVWRRRTGEGGQ